MVVPDHDLVDRVLRVGSAADKGEDVAPEEHLDEADPAAGRERVPAGAAGEVSAEDLAEWIAVVDSEAGVGAGGEAAVVLVKAEVEERRNSAGARVRALVVLEGRQRRIRRGRDSGDG